MKYYYWVSAEGNREYNSQSLTKIRSMARSWKKSGWNPVVYRISDVDNRIVCEKISIK